MKKWLVLGTVIVLVGVLAIPAFAGSTGAREWFQQMFEAKKTRVDSMVESGQLTEEQGQTFKEHFDRMYQWHEENGFVCPGDGMGPGQGRGPWWMNDLESGDGGFNGPGMGRGFRGGMGPGMMGGGYGSPASSSNAQQ